MMKTSWQNQIKILIVFFIMALLSACGEQTQEDKSVAKAPIIYVGPPSIGNDSATFNGVRSNYDITKNTQSYTIKDKVGSDGSTTLPLTTKSLIFKDIAINLAISTQAAEISSKDLDELVELYLAYFNRVPDANGLS